MKNLATNDRKHIELDIDPKLDPTKVNAGINSMMNNISKLQNMVDKLNVKGSNNNFTLSDKDQSNVRGLAGEVNNSASDLQGLIKSGMATYNDIRTTNPDSDKLEKISGTLNTISTALDRAYSQVGANGLNGKTDVSSEFNSKLQNILNMNTRSTSFATNGSSKDDITRLKYDVNNTIKNARSDVSNATSSARKSNNNVNDAMSVGTISEARLAKYRENIITGSSRLSNARTTVSNAQDSLEKQLGDRQAESNRIRLHEQNGGFAPNEQGGVNERKAVLDLEIKTLNDSIAKLKSFNKELDDSEKKLNNSNSTLEGAVGGSGGSGSGSGGNGTGGGGLTVIGGGSSGGGSGLGKLASLLIAGGAVTGAVRGVTSANNSGNSIRESAEDSVNSIMIGEANRTGTTSKHADNTILNNLQKTGYTNGTGYGTTAMTGFANAYTSSTGDTKNYLGAADAASQLSRYGNMGTTSTTSLISAIGNAGAGAGIANTTKSIQGELVNSGMTARGAEQGQALTSMIQNQSGQSLSAGNVRDLASLQGIQAKYGSVMQGAQGADAYNKVSTGLGNYNDPLLRNLFAGNNAKYAGAHGQALEYRDMQNMTKEPWKMGDMINGLQQMTGGDSAETAMYISQKTGVKYDQAMDYVNMNNQGKLTKSNIKRQARKNARTKGKGKQAYDKSGSKTIDNKKNIRERRDTKTSESGDGIRSVLNGITNVGLGILGGVGVSAITGAVGGAGLGGIASGALRGSRLGSSVLSKGKGIVSKGINAAKNSRLGSKVLSKGSDILKSTKNSSLVSRGVSAAKSMVAGTKGLVKGAIPAAKGAVKSATSGAKGIVKGASKAGKGLLEKGATKIGGKALGKIIPGVGIGVSAASGYDHVKKHHYIAAAGDAISGAGDAASMTGVGAVAGIPMSLIGTGISAASDFITGDKDNSKKSKDSKNSKKSKRTQHGKKSDSNSSSSKNKSLSKSKSTKSESVVESLADLLKGFNDMLDKASKVIADAKSIKSGSDSKSDSKSDDDSSSSSHTKGVEQWRSKIKKAASAMGQKVSNKQVETILKLIGNESGGDQAITGIDDGDGTGAAMGLMQYKKSTFDTYKLKGHTNIKNGYDQLLAFFNDSNWSSDIGVGYNGKDGEWRGQASGPSGKASHSSVPHATGGIYPLVGSHNEHATGAIYDRATTTDGTNIYAEAGAEAAIPVNTTHQYSGLATIKDLASVYGAKVTPTGRESGSSNNNIRINPNFDININISGNASKQDVEDGTTNAINNAVERMNALTDYYSKGAK